MGTKTHRQRKFRIFYTIQDGEYEYGDSFVVYTPKSSFKPTKDWAIREIVDWFASDPEEARQLRKEMKNDGMAMIEPRGIRWRGFLEIKPIRITIEGGVIQAIDSIPDETEVEIWDFETDGVGNEMLETNSKGEKFIRLLWSDRSEAIDAASVTAKKQGTIK